jgi:hypothetical protein
MTRQVTGSGGLYYTRDVEKIEFECAAGGINRKQDAENVSLGTGGLQKMPSCYVKDFELEYMTVIIVFYSARNFNIQLSSAVFNFRCSA